MQNAWVLNQEILINPELYQPWWYFMRIVCQQTILMKYNAYFINFEKAAKFEIVGCCKL